MEVKSRRKSAKKPSKNTPRKSAKNTPQKLQLKILFSCTPKQNQRKKKAKNRNLRKRIFCQKYEALF
jgi:hypothetical protein